MMKQYEVLVDKFTKIDDIIILEIDGRLLSFNGSVIEMAYPEKNEVDNIFSHFIPKKEESNVITIPKNIIEYFNLYDYCDDKQDEIDYENLNFTTPDFNLEELFD